MAAFAPMPMVTRRIAVRANPGDLQSDRMELRRSRLAIFQCTAAALENTSISAASHNPHRTSEPPLRRSSRAKMALISSPYSAR